MLIQFSVGNFRSFSEVQTFTLVASPLSGAEELDSTNVFAATPTLSLLKSAAIYGANAAGKSNLLRAMGFFRFMTTRSTKLEENVEIIPTEPFLLSTETETAPSFFEAVFMIKGVRYRYGFEADPTQIVSEWLYRQTSSRETRLFTRVGQKVDPNPAVFKEGVPFKTNVARNHCFLTVCASLQGPISRRVLTWFRSFNIISGLKDHAYMNFTVGRLIQELDKVAEVESLMRELDVNLDKVRLHFPQGRPDYSFKSAIAVDVVDTSLESASSSAKSQAESDIKPQTVEVKVLIPASKRDEKGHIVGEAELELGKHGSEGTQKLFAFAGPIVDTLKNGKVLFVDELDARLHPAMTCALVQLFNSSVSNPKNAQLVFATHDVNLLSSSMFRRDQIWFAEKNETGATHLYSLAQFRLENGELPRKDGSFEGDYIRGKFGAIPYIGNLAAIFEANSPILAGQTGEEESDGQA